MPTKILTDLKQRSIDEVIKGLLSKSTHESSEAGLNLCREAQDYGLNMHDYLVLATKSGDSQLDGYEMCLHALGLPIKNDFKNGIVLQAASDTFQTFPGTRAMFPPVIDNILQWANKQTPFETTASIVGNSRTMNGVELITTVVADDSAERSTSIVPELSNIPVNSIRTSEVSVKMFKHGSGLRTSYEFARRVALDVLTPYAARIARQLEISKVAVATSMLVNGDTVHAAAPVVTQSSFDSIAGVTSVANTISWQNFLAWLVSRAQLGFPIDTVVGNYDSAFRWAMLWQVPVNGIGVSNADQLKAVSAQVANLPIPLPQFAISSTAPAGKLIGYSKADTLEELIEAGSQISESDRAIRNQSITYLKTENTGYRIVYDGSRSIYNYNA